MKKIIYYYNRKYPEYDLTEIPVNGERFIVDRRHKYKYLDGIYANYDMSCMLKCEQEYFISLYSSYHENKEIYVHDTTHGNELIFSYNKELITQWRNDDIENMIHRLEKRLDVLKEAVSYEK